MNRAVVFFSAWLGLGSALLPADSLVNLPTGTMSCTVTATAHFNEAPADAPPGQPPPKVRIAETAVQVDRTGNLQRSVATWNDGNTVESWMHLDSGMTQVERFRGQTILDLPKNSGARVGIPLLDFTPESVAWISPHTRTAKVPIDFNGKPAMHYQTVVEIPQEGSLPPIRLTYQAWIDPKTLVPLAYDDGDYLYLLTFAKTAPTEPLVLPDRFKRDLQGYLNANAPVHHL